MKKILLFLLLTLTSVLSYGQTDVDIWKKSKFKVFTSRKFTFPKSFNSKSPSGKTITYQKLDQPTIYLETSSGKKWTRTPIVYKSTTDFGAIVYDGKNWTGIHTEDGFNVSNLTKGKVTTVKMDKEKFSYGEKEDNLLAPKKNNKRTGNLIQNNPDFYNPLIRINKTCGVYVEVTNDLYKFWGNDTGRVAQYVTTILTNVIALYDREGINVTLNKVFMWDTPDPYGNPFDNSQYLDIFTNNINQNKPTSPSAHFKHLLHNKNLGGIAWINGSSDGYTTDPSIDSYYACAVTGIGSNAVINNNITYSWPVMCFTHEMGHNLGARHTHWCGWKDDGGSNIGRIDSCFQGESSDGPNNCLTSSYNLTKSNSKGSIMSYCHLNGAISFTTGFGKYPRYVIRSNLNGASEIGFDGGGLPSITTNPITNIGTKSSTSGGNITSDGGSPIQSKGVIWSTTPNPLFDLSTKTSDGTGLGNFSSAITNLTFNTKYWVRAYAKNAVGISYGDTISFITLSQELPTVLTSSITSITQTTAISGSTVVNTGYNGTVSQRGIVWSTTSNPDISLSTKTSLGSGGVATSPTQSTLTGLSPNTTYYVRAYATNPTGTGYGNQISFTTLSTGIASINSNPLGNNFQTTTSFQANGILINDGGFSVTERGFCMNTTPNVDITMNKRVFTGSVASNATYTLIYNNLQPKTTYYYRPYVITSNGTFYGTEVNVTTLPSPVALDEIVSVEATKATFKYTVTPTYLTVPLSYSGILVSTNPTPSLANRNFFFTSSYIQLGQSTLVGTELLPNTTYYATAVIFTTTNVVYTSNILTFTTTSSVGTPTVLTTGLVSKTNNSLVIGGNVTSVGTSSVYSRGVCYSTAPNPTISNSFVQSGNGVGAFTSTLINLNPSIIYYVRAFATNKSGTSYGTEISVSTSGNTPTLTTLSVSSISLTTANCGGNITNSGGGIVTSRGIVWSKNPNPNISLPTKTVDGSGLGIYNSAITGLQQDTKYYVKAYATNENGTSYGNEVTFNTLPAPSVASVITNPIINILPTSATTGGNVTYDGGSSVTAKGVCWSTSRNPTVDLSTKTFNGSGVGPFESSISNLTLGVTYYVRAYATNSTGTNYGNEYSFTTSFGTPIITTSPITSITMVSAVVGGNVTSSGNTPVTQRGVCWSTTPNPTISDNLTRNGTGIGTFSTTISGLTSNTLYYVKAYAINSLGISYGSVQTFTTYTESVGSCQLSELRAYLDQNNSWNFSFKPNTRCPTYSVNVCRYNSNDPNTQPSSNQSPVICNVRNGMVNYSPNSQEISSNLIQRVMNPQPVAATRSGFGGSWYSIDVRCNSQNCSGTNLTKYFFFVP